MSKTFVVYMTALVNALKMTYVNLGSVQRGVCKPNDRLRISLLFVRLFVIRLKTMHRPIPTPQTDPRPHSLCNGSRHWRCQSFRGLPKRWDQPHCAERAAPRTMRVALVSGAGDFENA